MEWVCGCHYTKNVDIPGFGSALFMQNLNFVRRLENLLMRRRIRVFRHEKRGQALRKIVDYKIVFWWAAIEKLATTGETKAHMKTE